MDELMDLLMDGWVYVFMNGLTDGQNAKRQKGGPTNGRIDGRADRQIGVDTRA